jgi:hypothetical protein
LPSKAEPEAHRDVVQSIYMHAQAEAVEAEQRSKLNGVYPSAPLPTEPDEATFGRFAHPVLS